MTSLQVGGNGWGLEFYILLACGCGASWECCAWSWSVVFQTSYGFVTAVDYILASWREWRQELQLEQDWQLLMLSMKHRCRSRQSFGGAKNILPRFSQICPKNIFVQTFLLQIFCSCWYITFSSTMLPYILHFSDGRLIQPWRKHIRKYTNV